MKFPYLGIGNGMDFINSLRTDTLPTRILKALAVVICAANAALVILQREPKKANLTLFELILKILVLIKFPVPQPQNTGVAYI